jgi:hypothetical protein
LFKIGKRYVTDDFDVALQRAKEVLINTSDAASSK